MDIDNHRMNRMSSKKKVYKKDVFFSQSKNILSLYELAEVFVL